MPEDLNQQLKDAVDKKDLTKVTEFFVSNPNFGTNALVTKEYRNDLLRPVIENNQAEILDLLLQNQFKVGGALFTAVREGSKECAEKILPHINKNRGDKAPDGISSKRFLSPLMLAVHLEHYDIIELFVNNGYKVQEAGSQTKPTSVHIGGNSSKSEEEKEEERLETVRQNRETTVMQSLTRYHSYRALASPLYITYSYLKNNDKHPLFQIFHLNELIEKQGRRDFEFNKNYKDLSNELQKFAVNLLEQCRTFDNIDVITDISIECQEREDLKYLEVKSEVAEQLTVMKLAIRSDNVEFVAHPYSQLQLNETIYRDIYKIFSCEPSWRQFGLFCKVLYGIRHILLLPFLTLMYVFFSKTELGRGMKSPMVKYISHTGSFCIFILLLMLASFQDKLKMNVAEPTVLDWFILVWVFGLVVQEFKELHFQGFRHYTHQWWNIISFVMLVLFVTSYILSITAYIFSQVTDSEVFDKLSFEFTPTVWYKMMLFANGLFSLGMVMSFLYLLSAFQVSRIFGPMQLSLYNILADVVKFMTFFFTVFVAYGFSLRRLYSHYISTQKYIQRGVELGLYNTTMAPDTEHAFSDVSHSFYSLFWAMFGMADINEFATKDNQFKITRIIGEALFGSFLIIMVIIAVNMLIAMMSRSYEAVADNADNRWRMSRTKMWMNWVDKGNVIPPPLNIFAGIKIIIKSLRHCGKRMKKCCPCWKDEARKADIELQKKLKAEAEELKKEKKENREKICTILRRYLRQRKNNTNQENEQRMQGIKDTLDNMYKQRH